MRLPSTSGVASTIAGARRQQRRGFVMVDAAKGTLADVRREMERSQMPVPRPFAFVLDLARRGRGTEEEVRLNAGTCRLLSLKCIR